jgi:hypothetical protein
VDAAAVEAVVEEAAEEPVLAADGAGDLVPEAGAAASSEVEVEDSEPEDEGALVEGGEEDSEDEGDNSPCSHAIPAIYSVIRISCV